MTEGPLLSETLPRGPKARPRGRLKVFLGYSSGAGKSYRMLDEGRRRCERGEDVVVGAVQAYVDPTTANVLRQLPCIPMLAHGSQSVMDVESILHRQPEICLIDGMAYDNPPGAPHAHRWQEIETLLAAGISVVASVNLQFIEERQDEIELITGRRSTQTVPARLLLQSDEIEIVDAPPPSSPANPVSPGEETERRQLLALREVALLFTADVVDRQLESYLTVHGIEARLGAQERILVCITPGTEAGGMIESGWRNAERFRGELIVAHVHRPRHPPASPPAGDERFQANLQQARQERAEIVMLEGKDFVDTIVPFAYARGVTQIFVGHGAPRRWRLRGNALDRLIAAATDIDIRVFPRLTPPH
ncbi:MAG TPA: hypothetical protein VIC54_14740 [Terriglobales bacterium]|jgi:two-component system sensor histidine kinase KdpD